MSNAERDLHEAACRAAGVTTAADDICKAVYALYSASARSRDTVFQDRIAVVITELESLTAMARLNRKE